VGCAPPQAASPARVRTVRILIATPPSPPSGFQPRVPAPPAPRAVRRATPADGSANWSAPLPTATVPSRLRDPPRSDPSQSANFPPPARPRWPPLGLAAWPTANPHGPGESPMPPTNTLAATRLPLELPLLAKPQSAPASLRPAR